MVAHVSQGHPAPEQPLSEPLRVPVSEPNGDLPQPRGRFQAKGRSKCTLREVPSMQSGPGNQQGNHPLGGPRGRGGFGAIRPGVPQTLVVVGILSPTLLFGRLGLFRSRLSVVLAHLLFPPVHTYM
jgi:hypothetical protein